MRDHEGALQKAMVAALKADPALSALIRGFTTRHRKGRCVPIWRWGGARVGRWRRTGAGSSSG